MKIYTSNNLFRFLVISVLALFPAILFAGEYIIKKGDTLWDISEEKMRDPFLWKKLWKANPHIKNPDLIFPGQKLNIPRDVVENKKEGIQEEIGVVPKKTEGNIIPVKVMPKTIPAQKKNYLTSKEILLQGGYISDDVKSIGKIYGSSQKKTLLGRGDYVCIETEKPTHINDKFYILNQPEKVIHPVTEDHIGYLIRIKGIIEVVGEDNGNKKALVIESYNEITIDDMLITFYPVESPIEPDKQRRPAVTGYIIKLWDKYNMSSAGSIVYLDKGALDGIEIGDMFNVFSSEKPHIPLGTIQVITTKDKTSVALLKKAFSEVKAGDLFRN
ncbi:peptidoglycan-binding protein LysM [Dissulfurispira thermophila]|uniref:Peptidoglycan-binding protein LysM n=1 Tax=Dissulfurispira thermophila TaxID=2715679 RepID=A0A7G1H6H2_9BACT|nr:LysM peptidoglycan-binding domain-containing protein [Dissulfurispira thermophila]BCB97347.1 peptidoglycan-binding protein LysM [Dissulfurispira thermophila]